MATPVTTIDLEGVGSTQDEARNRFAGSPVLVVTHRQTAGRGRSGAAWETAPRALAASLAFEPGWSESAVARLTLVAGLAALDALGEGLGLKWPNDVMAGDSKVGGILTERGGDVVVVGLGANLWWPDPPAGYGAWRQVDPGPAAPGEVARRWAERLVARVAEGPDAWGRSEYEAVCVTVGKHITWEPGGSGIAVGIDSTGGLVVSTPSGDIVLSSGEIRSVRAPGGSAPPG